MSSFNQLKLFCQICNLGSFPQLGSRVFSKTMANNGVFSRLKRVEGTEGMEDLFDSHEVHVLAVDDSLVDRKVIERLLKITSCKVTAVDSGRRALQYLGLDEEENPAEFDGLKVDLIITDYCMPGMTGYELLKKIKGSSTFREIPVVIMSSENVLARIDRCLEEGAEDFIVKPVKLSDVERLKSYMIGEGRIQRRERCFNERKSCESSDSASLPSPSPPSSPYRVDNSSSRSPPSTSSPSSPKMVEPHVLCVLVGLLMEPLFYLFIFLFGRHNGNE